MIIRVVCQTDNTAVTGPPFFDEGPAEGEWSVDTSEMYCSHGPGCEWIMEVSTASEPVSAVATGERVTYHYRNEI